MGRLKLEKASQSRTNVQWGHETLSRLSIFLQKEIGEYMITHISSKKAYRRHTQVLMTSQHIQEIRLF